MARSWQGVSSMVCRHERMKAAAEDLKSLAGKKLKILDYAKEVDLGIVSRTRSTAVTGSCRMRHRWYGGMNGGWTIIGLILSNVGAMDR